MSAAATNLPAWFGSPDKFDTSAWRGKAARRLSVPGNRLESGELSARKKISLKAQGLPEAFSLMRTPAAVRSET
ncbi:MAG: hypothetical protein ACXW6T_15745 [Candidatus Binatia bacterium]